MYGRILLCQVPGRVAKKGIAATPVWHDCCVEPGAGLEPATIRSGQDMSRIPFFPIPLKQTRPGREAHSAEHQPASCGGAGSGRRAGPGRHPCRSKRPPGCSRPAAGYVGRRVLRAQGREHLPGGGRASGVHHRDRERGVDSPGNGIRQPRHARKVFGPVGRLPDPLAAPAPDARAAPPEAHESLISRKTGAEVPLTGLSVNATEKKCFRFATPSLWWRAGLDFVRCAATWRFGISA